MKHIPILLFCLVFSYGHAQKAAKRHAINGYVYEKGSKETIVGATLYFPDLKLGTTTNGYGFFSITVPDSGNQQLIISFVGYTPLEESVYTGSSQSVNYTLELRGNLKEVVVDAKRLDLLQSTRMSTIEIPVEQLKQIPAIGGEKDIVKALQLLPGVQKGSEGSAGLYVRGGGPDQNLIILDDAPVYNANHLFGFFSTFNGDALKSVELIKGGFPARYGGRLSSVLNLTMKEGNKEKIQGEFGIGLVSSRITLEGPLKKKKGKSSFLVSGRRTYIDALTAPLIALSTGGATGGYYFYDLNLKVNTVLNPKNRFYFSSYFGRDRFYFRLKENDFLVRQGLNWGNLTATGRWNHQFAANLFSNTSLIVSDYTFGVFQTAKQSSTGREYVADFSSGIRDFTLKTDLNYTPLIKHSFKIGGLLTYHIFTPKAVVTKDDFSTENASNSKEQIGSIETGLYIEDDWRPLSWVSFNTGLRFSSFLPKNEQYLRLEPRLGLRVALLENVSYKASYTVMNQYLHLLSNSTPGLPTDLWVPATQKVKPQHAEQYATGFTAAFPKKGIELTIEGYYKSITNNLTYKDGASFLVENPAAQQGNQEASSYEKLVSSGKGRAYGIELFVQYERKKFIGWVGYTYSRSFQTFADINEGKEFRAKYDRPNDLSIVGSYQINAKWKVSTTWVYGSGGTLTLPEGQYPIHVFGSGFSSTKVDQLGPRNGFRAEAYHRLDLAFQNTKQKKHGIRTWEYGLYNAYNRNNPFFYFVGRKDRFNGNDQRLALFRVALIPVIPSISYSYKF